MKKERERVCLPYPLLTVHATKMAEEGAAVGIPDVIHPDYQILVNSYPKLVKCIARSPEDITDELIPYTIFSDEEIADLRSKRHSKKEKARIIIDTIISKVKSEPSFFYTFLSIMERLDWMNDELRENLGAKPKSNSKPTNPNPESSNTNAATPDVPESQNIHAGLNTESMKKKPLNVDKSDLENMTTRIQHKFAALVSSVSWALKHKGEEGVTTNELALHLRGLNPQIVNSDHIKPSCFCLELIEQIEEECQNDVQKVFIYLQKFYSWINFDLIYGIIQAFLRDNDAIQTQWAEYQTDYKEYCNERAYDISTPLNGIRTVFKLKQKTTEVVFKIDHEWRQISFDWLNSIRASITRLLGLKPFTLYLFAVERGCVELVFEVPQHVADVIFPPTEEQLLALQEHKIRYYGELKCIIATISLYSSTGSIYFTTICYCVLRVRAITLNCIIMSL